MENKYLKPLSTKDVDYALFDCFAHPADDDYKRYTNVH